MRSLVIVVCLVVGCSKSTPLLEECWQAYSKGESTVRECFAPNARVQNGVRKTGGVRAVGETDVVSYLRDNPRSSGAPSLIIAADDLAIVILAEGSGSSRAFHAHFIKSQGEKIIEWTFVGTTRIEGGSPLLAPFDHAYVAKGAPKFSDSLAASFVEGALNPSGLDRILSPSVRWDEDQKSFDKATLIGTLTERKKSFDSYDFVPRNELYVDDLAVVFGKVTGTRPSDGRYFEIPAAFVYRSNGNQILEIVSFLVEPLPR